MTFNNQKQLSQFEDDLFNLALLGLLEIEGRALVQEDERLRKSGGYDDIPEAPKSELAKIERMLRRQQIKKKVTNACKRIAPVFTKIAVFFMVFWIGAGAVFATSAEAREMLYQLIVEQYEKYSVIEPDWNADELPADAQEYLAAGAVAIPTYVPDQFKLAEIESGIYSVNAYYEGVDQSDLFLSFKQIVSSDSDILKIDTENADSIQNVMIGDSLGMIVQKEQTVQIVWNIGNRVFFVLTNAEYEDALQFAAGVQPLS